MRIRTEKYEIIESDMIIVPGDTKDVWIDLEVSGEKLGEINLCFQKDETSEKKLLCKNTENGVLIECTNFDSIMGTGTAIPIPIGEIDEKEIFIAMWSYRLGEGNLLRKIEYTILRGI